MAATELTFELKAQGGGQLLKSLGLSNVEDNVTLSEGGFGDLDTVLSFGTASGQANNWYHAENTLAAAGNTDLDLAGSLANPFGETISFTAVKLVLVAVVDPDGTKKVRVGPQNVTNGWQGPFGGVGATNYKEVVDWEAVASNRFGGYAVTAGSADVLRINNPTGVSLTYRILIVGVG